MSAATLALSQVELSAAKLAAVVARLRLAIDRRRMFWWVVWLTRDLTRSTHTLRRHFDALPNDVPPDELAHLRHFVERELVFVRQMSRAVLRPAWAHSRVQAQLVWCTEELAEIHESLVLATDAAFNAKLEAAMREAAGAELFETFRRRAGLAS